MNVKDGLIDELVREGYLKTPRIIDAFRAIDRADFVLPEYKDEAYGNYPLPIGEGQTISQPLTVAFMLELLDPQSGEKILDVGCGSGWTTALLSSLVGSDPAIAGSDPTVATRGKVIGIERIPELCRFGQKNLVKYFPEERAKIICGDGTRGLLEEAPFDKILSGASASAEIPDAWVKQLKVGGKIVAPVGGSIWLFTKKSEKELDKKEFPGFVFVPLVASADKRRPDADRRGENSAAVKNEALEARSWYPGAIKIYRTIGYWLLAIGLVTVIFANEIYRPHPSYIGSKSIEISSGLGSRKIADVLKNEGVIRSKWVFIIYVSLTGNATSLKPGNYVFSRESIPKVVGDLARGGTNEYVITVPEGWSSRDIAAYFEENGLVSPDEFLNLVSVKHSVFNNRGFDFLGDRPAKVGLEGYLFPDTYRIFKDSGAEDIVSKMLENFGKKLAPELREEIERQKKTIFEVVIMASLIEKEASSDEDRVVISGILWKRLKIGMALQVDASINYITNKKTPSASKEDLMTDSPYNTYKYPGLPIGPIANPGLSAIHAAIYPKESLYLYYLHTPEGQTIFSSTLEEHNEAKAKYLR